MKLMEKVTHILDRTNTSLAFVVGVILIFMLLSVNAEVFMRYVLNRHIMWVIEIAGDSIVYITFLGAAWLLAREGHVAMDVVIIRLAPRRQALLNCLTSIMGSIIFVIVTWYGARVTLASFLGGITSPTYLEIPEAPVLIAIPIGSFLLFAQCLRRAHRYLAIWRGLSENKQSS